MFVFGPNLLQRFLSIGGALAVAAFIGFFMQLGSDGSAAVDPKIAGAQSIRTVPAQMAEIETVVVETSTNNVEEQFLAIPALTSKLTALTADDITENKSVPDCAVNLVAAAGAAALVDVIATAPCYAGEMATVHHEGMMFSVSFDENGKATFKVPALKLTTVVMVSFADGSSKSVQVDTPSLAFYDRVVLQWQGEAGLQFHAFEYGAGYEDDGHIWFGAPKKVSNAASGDGGFLLRFGDTRQPDSLVAEVYTFPSGIAHKLGNIEMTVEAEISAQNCSREVGAQTLQFNAVAGLTISDLSLNMPGCDAIGEFLVLNNLVETMKLALN